LHRAAGRPLDKWSDKQRNRIERLIDRCKQHSSLRNRHDKRAPHYRAFWVIAMTILWIRQTPQTH
jgi:hypothetical protein